MKMKYSFIVPVYGCEEYLESCVESILAQRGNHAFEIILVDDGSKDNSGQIADMLALKDPRVCTFHKENGGAASARNFGLAQAKGEYILFVDSDDTVEDRLLDSVDAVLAENPQALVIFGMAFDYYMNEILDRQDKLSCRYCGKYSITEVLENFKVLFDDNALSSACNKVFRRDIIQKNDLIFSESMNLYEDFDFVINYLTCTVSVFLVDELFYHYRLHREDNHLHKLVKDISNLKNNMLILEQSIKRLLLKGCMSSEVYDVYAGLNVSLLSLHLYVNRHPICRIEKIVKYYFANSDFSELFASGIHYGKNARNLLQHIKNEQYLKIYFIYRKRQVFSSVKNTVKSILKL